MLNWEKNEVIRPSDIQPSAPGLRVIGAFNPGAVLIDGAVHLLVRVAEALSETRPGEIGLPRWSENRIVHDWFPGEQLEPIDARVVRLSTAGTVRLTSVSHLRLVTVDANEADQPNRYRVTPTRLLPEGEWEEYGIEDPRITRIDDRYYVTYVAVSRHGACTALASTTDFQTFERHGIIFPPENKDVVLFPRRIQGRYVALHRPVCATPFTMPEMWLGFSNDLIYWGDHRPLRCGGQAWESGRTGAGAPPLATAQGWLELFHGNRRPEGPGHVGIYSGGAMLLDLEDPRHVLRTLAQPVIVPDQRYEREGFVADVVFPTALLEVGERMAVYYGAADTSTAVAFCSADDFMRLFTQDGDG